MRTGLVLPSRIGNWATTLSLATSMTVTFPPASANTQARAPSGVNATVRGLSPTCSVFRRRPVLASSTDTVLFVSAVTYNFVPSRVTPTPSGSTPTGVERSEEHTSELQSLTNLVCRLLLEKKKQQPYSIHQRSYESC